MAVLVLTIGLSVCSIPSALLTLSKNKCLFSKLKDKILKHEAFFFSIFLQYADNKIIEYSCSTNCANTQKIKHSNTIKYNLIIDILT